MATPAETPEPADMPSRDGTGHQPRPRATLWARLIAPLLTGFRAGRAGHPRGGVARPDRAPYGTRPCAGCGAIVNTYRAGGVGTVPDQRVPDPAQFTGKPDHVATGKPVEPALIDADMILCSCGMWYHSVGCFSTHRH
jgi:hypothetical protein